MELDPLLLDPSFQRAESGHCGGLWRLLGVTLTVNQVSLTCATPLQELDITNGEDGVTGRGSSPASGCPVRHGGCWRQAGVPGLFSSASPGCEANGEAVGGPVKRDVVAETAGQPQSLAFTERGAVDRQVAGERVADPGAVVGDRAQ